MVFSSFAFLFGLLPATLAGYHGCRMQGWALAAKTVLITASLVFYAWSSLVFLPLVLGSVAVNYALGALLHRRGGRALFWLGIAFNLGLLGWFKYSTFLGANLAWVAGQSFFVHAVVLPLAISFFTFQQVAYLVEIRRGAVPARSPVDYALFILFFPHLVAGPITHHTEMLPQFARAGRGPIDRKQVMMGVCILIIGLAKKTLLADPLATIADPVFAAAAVAGGAVTAVQAWQGALAYTFQLYFDFSGYSDMAIGLGLLFGVRLPVNFASPYRAGSMIEFWRRWHITLGRFLRAYVYIPLGGNRHGPLRRHANLLATMLLGGFWHGAGWNFIAWGGLHGACLVINHLWRGAVGEARDPYARLASWAVTFLAVVVGWVLFRSASIAAAGTMLAAMAGVGMGAGMGEALAMPGPLITGGLLAGAAAIAGLSPDLLSVTGHGDGVPRWPAWLRPGATAAGLGVVAALCVARLPNPGVFLYFNF